MEDFSPAGRRRGRGLAPAAAATAIWLVLPLLTAPAAAAAPPPGRPRGRGPAWCAPNGPLTVRSMPRTVRLADCDLRGRTLRAPDGLSALVPADWTSVAAHVLRTDGAAELRVQPDRWTRRFTISMRGLRDPRPRPRRTSAPLDPCADGMYQLEPSKWAKGSTVEWRFSAGSSGRPVTGIATGVSNTFTANTDCTPEHRYTPPPDVSEHYAGETAAPPNLTGDASCGARDQANTFGWLPMPGAEPNMLAATCIWFLGPRTLETDMALQTAGKTWWSGKNFGDPNATCPPGAYDASAIATHETGHVLGLAHVEGPDHTGLTMTPAVGSCDDGPATLGKGDYDGLISLYGGR